MINQTNYIPAEYREKAIGKNRFISLLTIASIIALLALIFLILTCLTYVRHAYQKRTHQITTINKDGYAQPLEQSVS